LPSEPKIFHGRDKELSDIPKLFGPDAPRIAILGAGGIGKTSLAQVIVHHPDIIAKYEQHRHFVVCDSATNQMELAALIGAHLGLKPANDLTHLVVHHFSGGRKSLLILDNLETSWEPTESREKIEEFLSLLTDVEHLSLIITMRGSERPAKVRWARPFLRPLNPLAQEAALKTFLDIVDDRHDPIEVDKVLALTNNMPLAINLMSHLVDSDGCANVLPRWEREKTSLMSGGYDKRSNLDLSITLSLSSPRISSVPHSKKLLSLLSILPDGPSDVELVQSKLPVDDIFSCKTALVRTALAYNDQHKRLKVLVPVREYMQKIHPPGDHFIQPLFEYFHEILQLYKKYHGTQSVSAIVDRISLNYLNIQNILQNRL
ncbi:P-loop containing nucleoside triphosphate hydrolase protein, partial [Mycena leptocephala]